MHCGKNQNQIKYMRLILYTITITTCLYLMVACNANPQPGAKALLEQAENLVDTYPDSAMTLIDSLFFPEKSLRHKDYMRFLVTQVQAKYKTFRPIAEDTLVFQARDYFSGNNKDPRMAALAWFYSGCLYRERKEYPEATQHYSMAGEYAAQTGDMPLQGLVQYNMGDLFVEQGLYKEALDYYTQAEGFYRQSPDKPHEKQAQCLSAMGRTYMYLQQPDSAFWYFHKGLELAETAGDTGLLSLLAQNLSVAYINTGQLDNAESYLRQSYLLNTDSTKLPRYYLIFAELYAGMGRQDSAAAYTGQLLRHIDTATDNYFKASAFSYLAGWEKARGNYDAAFMYQQARMEIRTHIMEERANQSVYEANRKYSFELLQKQHYMEITKKQIWIIALLAIVMGSGVFSIYFRNRQMESQRKIGTLQEMKRDLESAISQKQQDLRNSLLWRFNLSRKMFDYNIEMKKMDKNKYEMADYINQLNQIVFGKMEINELWDALLVAFNETRPGLAEKIRIKYPDLTKKEYRITIFWYIGLSVKETAKFLGQSSYTIQTRRSDIRRKMGLDKRGDIAAHIDQI